MGERIVVQREESEEMTAGGIVLPDSAQEKPQRGKDEKAERQAVLRGLDRFSDSVSIGVVAWPRRSVHSYHLCCTCNADVSERLGSVAVVAVS